MAEFFDVEGEGEQGASGSAGSSIDWRNGNSLWSSVLIETWVRCGLTTAVVCPGSRSTPLTIALACHPQVEAIPVLDERSGAFLALGRSRMAGNPVVLVCTSGTAGANFFPAVIEARESGVPLIVVTADRPPELRDCSAGQAIDQVRLFGSYPVAQAELALPEPTWELLSYLRQTAVMFWQRSRLTPGPVHLNAPFRDPLPPLPDPRQAGMIAALRDRWAQSDFFQSLAISSGTASPSPVTLPSPRSPQIDPPCQAATAPILTQWRTTERGLIIVGPACPVDPQRYCQEVGAIARALGWPVLAEGLSPLRNYADHNPTAIAGYDLILRNRAIAAQLQPQQIIQLGSLPTSKPLREWLAAQPAPRWVIDPGDRNRDPLHGPTHHLTLDLATLATLLTNLPEPSRPDPLPDRPPDRPSPYTAQWLQADRQIQRAIARLFDPLPEFVESKVAWVLARSLPPGTPLFISNSMPVRDVETVWPLGDRAIRPQFNRGANGIDGSLSTAIGMVWGDRPGVMLTGDLALLHDTNGFLQAQRLRGHLTIVLINNNGGGIFGMLPIAQFDPPFEDFFATPQTVDWAKLGAAYGVEYELIVSWEQLRSRIAQLPATGVRLLEVRCDRHHDAQWRKIHYPQLAATLT
jgi:2-succinyl-5-enolpyruvyl-6-hydroxy-3-cyclohexene-1-carboxylate synthase